MGFWSKYFRLRFLSRSTMGEEASILWLAAATTVPVMLLFLRKLLPYTEAWDAGVSWKFFLAMVVFCVCSVLIWLGLNAMFRRHPMRLVPWTILFWAGWIWVSWQNPQLMHQSWFGGAEIGAFQV